VRLIDFHTHPWRPGDLAASTVEFIRGISPTVQQHGDALSDPGFAADLLRADGVDHAVLLAEHCPRTSGVVRTETVIDLCRQSNGFFLPFASVDPTSDAAPADFVERAIVDGGVRGLKLYPSYQFFYPNDASFYPVYEVCQQHRVPVLLHIGSSVLRGTRMKYCDPIHLDDVAVDFPDLSIVMAHGGRGFWYEVCAFLASHHENVHIDVTGLVPRRLLEHFPRMERMADKFVFGSDWPALPRTVAQNVAAVSTLGLSDDALERILWRNAARLLRLDADGPPARA
jgi:predicted TIM-barrel fold metal-dependent hydrolase